MNITLPISEARKKIFEIVQKVQLPDVRYTLTENGRAKAVVLSLEEYESWAETVDVLWDIPDLRKIVEKTERDIKAGNFKDYISLEELTKKDGIIVKEPGSRYEVSRRIRKTSAKRSKKTAAKRNR